MPAFNLGRAVGQVDIDTRGLKEADISLREAGRGLLYTGGALVGAFGYVVKVAADFEREMDFVAAINLETAETMQQLSDYAVDLGRRGPYGPREVAAAFVELAKAGIDAEAIMAGMGEASVDLAAAADIGLTESTEILVNTLKTFDLQAEDSIYVVDQIAGAANASTIDVDDFAYSLRYAGSIAAAVGIPLDQVATSLAILGDRGIKGSTGGTSLRRVLLNLQPASEKAADTLKELGIITEDGTNAFFTAEGQAKSLSEVFQILNEATAGLTDAQRLKAFNTIFGARAAPSALILAGQGAEGFEKYTEAISQTTAADVAAARLDNLSGAILKLKAALEATFITAGSPFQKMLQGWVEALTAVVVWFGELDPRIQSFILGAVGILGVLSLLAGAFLLTVGNIIRAIRVMGQLAGFFSLLGGSKGAAGAASQVGLLSRAFGFLLSPVGLIVLAIVAAVAAFIYFYKTSETFRNFINGLGEDIQRIWGAVVDFFTGPFINAIETAWNAVSGFFGDIGGFFANIGSAIGGAASSVGSFFSDLFGGIAGAGSGAFDAVTGFFGTLGDIDLGGAFSRALATVTEFVGEIPGMLSGAASSALEGFLGFMAKLPGRLGYIFGFAIGRFLRWNIDFVTGMYDLGEKVIKAVVDWGGRLITAFGNWLRETSVRVALWVVDMVNQVIQLGTQFLVQITTFFVQLPGIIGGFLLDVLVTIIGAIPGIVAAAADLGLQVLTAVVGFVMQLPGQIWGFLMDVGSNILSAIPQIAGFAMEFGEGIFNGIMDFVAGIPGAIWDALMGGINTLRNLASTAASAARDFGSGLWNGFKDGMGISSPSYIEKALFAVEEQAATTAKHLNYSIGYINDKARRLPEFATAGAPAVAMISNDRMPQSVIAGTDSGAYTYNQNAPLIGEATIRDDRDIDKLARELEKRRNLRARSRGVKVDGF